MYAFLLIVGALAAATGIALVASGAPVNEFGLSSTLIIAGTTLASGGLILIGLGVAVRELQRIARALTMPAMPRAARPAEASVAVAEAPAAVEPAAAPAIVAPAAAPAPAPAAPAPAAVAPAPSERPSPPARIPFPAKPRPETRPLLEPSVSAAPAPPSVEETAFDRLRQKFPSLARIDSAQAVEEMELSLPQRGAPRTEEYAESRNAPSGPANGADMVQNAPRLEMPTRPAPERPSKISMFDSFWPKDGRRGKPGPEQPAEADVIEPPEPAPRPLPDTHSVSILKSGVVDGMAYTLYSDGSIEAQLPQGTVRFGSITDLRLHLERNG